MPAIRTRQKRNHTTCQSFESRLGTSPSGSCHNTTQITFGPANRAGDGELKGEVEANMAYRSNFPSPYISVLPHLYNGVLDIHDSVAFFVSGLYHILSSGSLLTPRCELVLSMYGSMTRKRGEDQKDERDRPN